jgi:hypothetical protein
MFNPHLQGHLGRARAEDLRRDANRVWPVRSQRQVRSAAQTRVSPHRFARRLIAPHRH